LFITGVAVGTGVWLGVALGRGVSVGTGVQVGVSVGAGVAVSVGRGVAVLMGKGVGGGEMREPRAATGPSSTSRRGLPGIMHPGSLHTAPANSRV
jgi:hypothetical protein